MLGSVALAAFCGCVAFRVVLVAVGLFGMAAMLLDFLAEWVGDGLGHLIELSDDCVRRACGRLWS